MLKPDSPIVNTIALVSFGIVAVYFINRALTRTAAAAVDAVGDAAWAVTPWNNDNVIYQTVNRPVQWITGDPNETLGGAVYEVTHNGTFNPNSTNNIIYRNIRPGGQSLGSWLYDVLN